MKHLNIFHNLHHICIVVRNIEVAEAYYESIGIGPWHDYPPLDAFRSELDVPDVDAFFKLRYRYANLENFQIQLCEPSEGNSKQRQFLETRGEGVFHLGFTVPDCDKAEKLGIESGLQTLMRGRRPDRSGFTYFDTLENGAGVTLEIRASAIQ